MNEQNNLDNEGCALPIGCGTGCLTYISLAGGTFSLSPILCGIFVGIFTGIIAYKFLYSVKVSQSRLNERIEIEKNAQILGISPNAHFAVIKKVYDKRIKEYQQHLVDALGEDIRKLAERKKEELHAAYIYFENREQQHLQAELERRRPYAECLGVPPDADFATIKQAYQQRLSEYQTDSAAALGEDFRILAEEKTKAIHKAYNFFALLFGQPLASSASKPHRPTSPEPGADSTNIKISPEEYKRQKEERSREVIEELKEKKDARQKEEPRREEEPPRAFTATELRYFSILDVKPGASFAEIKKGYQRRVMEFHPDNVAHLNEDVRRVAKIKMQAVEEAYAYFERLLG